MQFRPITCYQIRGTQQLWQSDVPAGGKTTIKTFPPQGRDVCVRARLHVFVLFFLFHTLTEDKLKWNQCWTVTLINSTSVLYMNMSIFLLLANDSPPNITLLLLAVTHHYLLDTTSTWFISLSIHPKIKTTCLGNSKTIFFSFHCAGWKRASSHGREAK